MPEKAYIIMIYAFFGDVMKRMVGFILFWIAIGMLLMILIHNILIGIIIIGILLLLGYNLFC